MSRDNCSMCYDVGGKVLCGFYDYGYMDCENVKTCPQGNDNDDDYDDYDNYNPED